MASTPEGRLTNRVRRYLKKVPTSYFFKVHGAASQVTGISDFIGVWKGKFVAIELKAPENKRGMTRRQQLFQKRVRKAGGIAFEARTLREVRNFFENESSEAT